MKEVNIKKSEVLEALKKNREQFKKDYTVALEGYRLSIINIMGNYLRDFKKLKLEEIDTFPNVPYSYNKPQNHTEEFDTAISMLELEVNDTITLTANEYKQYFLNKWSWYERWRVDNEGNIGIGTDSPGLQLH